MKIDKIEAFLVRWPLQKPFRIANRTIDHCDTVVVRMESGGLSGWGEVTPGNLPYITSAWSHGVFLALREALLPLFSPGIVIESAERLAEILAPVQGNRHAKGAIDMAWLDLDARLRNEPLWKTIGGMKRPIEVGLTFDRYDDHDVFFADLERAKNDHFHRISLKIRPGWEIQAVAAARDTCPWPMMIQVDFEGALNPDCQTDILYRVQDFLPTLIEQPFSKSDYVGHAMIQEVLRVPVALDESIKSISQANIALDLRSGEVFSVKPGRVGGLTEGKGIHDAARAREVTCYGGMDLTSGVGVRHLLAISSLAGFTLPCDWLRFDEIFPEESLALPFPEATLHQFPKTKERSNPLSSSVPEASNDSPTEFSEFRAVDLWDEPGIGAEPDRSVFEKFAVAACLIG